MADREAKYLGGPVIKIDEHGVPHAVTHVVELENGAHWAMTKHFRRDQVELIKRAEEGSDDSAGEG